MAKLFAFRHGQTTFNRDRIFTGWLDPNLTAVGLKECMRIAEELKDEGPTKAYASDLLRSRRTLCIVLRDRKNVPIIIDPRIKERNYGDLKYPHLKVWDFHQVNFLCL
ncbi:MAG: histidine phosphatase family protein [Candidatus Micrarchaeaceae archaeon]